MAFNIRIKSAAAIALGMKAHLTGIPEGLIIEYDSFVEFLNCFTETYSHPAHRPVGVDLDFVPDNQSLSVAGVKLVGPTI